MKKSAKELRHDRALAEPEIERRARRGLLAAGVTAALVAVDLLIFVSLFLLIEGMSAGALATYLLGGLLLSGAVGVIYAMK